ncbi:hypothetical protein GPX89_20175 [Nocardia sp. ET3-3]|uniref:Uncharacterized protein n=1 Tax=Nocardia terrae TaxID=2675851 RepID=A0A7K1UZ22_9NOCA|nr:hypothetical protein [Nocardia terrae]MVU79552.1 hypothetical protein [Nocardia terrae]
MTTPVLSAAVRELPALGEQIAETARPYIGDGLVLEVATGLDTADSNGYRDMVRTWRSPVRLLLLSIPDAAAAGDAYDDWVHWIAGGGLLAIADNEPLHTRALASGKFRDLGTVADLHLLQRIAACN